MNSAGFLVEQRDGIGLEDHHRGILADAGGNAADPALVAVGVFQTACGVLAAIAPGHVVSDEHGHRALLFGLAHHVLYGAVDVRVPLAEPERLGLFGDLVERLGLLRLLAADGIGAQHGQRLRIDPELDAGEGVAADLGGLRRLVDWKIVTRILVLIPGAGLAAGSRRRAGLGSLDTGRKRKTKR
jgi:hypothetical protein